MARNMTAAGIGFRRFPRRGSGRDGRARYQRSMYRWGVKAATELPGPLAGRVTVARSMMCSQSVRHEDDPLNCSPFSSCARGLSLSSRREHAIDPSSIRRFVDRLAFSPSVRDVLQAERNPGRRAPDADDQAWLPRLYRPCSVPCHCRRYRPRRSGHRRQHAQFCVTRRPEPPPGLLMMQRHRAWLSATG